LAKRRANEETPEFRERYRFRAGIEGTISAYDARTGVKELRVRGLEAVRFCATLKATGINIFRAAVVRRALRDGSEALAFGKSGFCGLYLFFKELWETMRSRFYRLIPPMDPFKTFEAISAF
jgi:hypothetical protein